VSHGHNHPVNEEELQAVIEYAEALEDELRAAGKADLIPERPPELRGIVSKKRAAADALAAGDGHGPVRRVVTTPEPEREVDERPRRVVTE
jgi:hypothetical protein